MKETTMLSNLYRRISIWWGEQLHRWEKRRHGRNSYPWKGQND